jgi:hypothetical protein
MVRAGVRGRFAVARVFRARFLISVVWTSPASKEAGYTMERVTSGSGGGHKKTQCGTQFGFFVNSPLTKPI